MSHPGPSMSTIVRQERQLEPRDNRLRHWEPASDEVTEVSCATCRYSMFNHAKSHNGCPFAVVLYSDEFIDIIWDRCKGSISIVDYSQVDDSASEE